MVKNEKKVSLCVCMRGHYCEIALKNVRINKNSFAAKLCIIVIF